MNDLALPHDNQLLQENDRRYLQAARHWIGLSLQKHAIHSPPQRAAQVQEPRATPSPVTVVHSTLAAPPVKGGYWGFRKWLARAPVETTPVETTLATLSPQQLPPQQLVAQEVQPATDPARDAEVAARKQLEHARALLQEAADADPPPSLIHLRRQLQLSEFEHHVLLLCVVMELNAGLLPLCSAVEKGPRAPYPTFALAGVLFGRGDEGPPWEALQRRAPLRWWNLVEINQPHGQNLLESRLRADEHIVGYAQGLRNFDDRIASFFQPVELPAGEMKLPPSQNALVAEIVCYWPKEPQSKEQQSPAPLVQLVGPDAPSKQWIAAFAARESGRALFRLSAEALPATPGEVEELSRLWQRESRLRPERRLPPERQLPPLALYLDGSDAEPTSGKEGKEQAASASLGHFLACHDEMILVGISSPLPRLARPTLILDVARPTPDEQRAAWNTWLGDGQEAHARALGGQFDLDLPALERIATARSQNPHESSPESLSRLWDACRVEVRPGLGHLAGRIDAKAKWRDLVLPRSERQVLQQIARQVGQRSLVYDEWGFRPRMNRGLGISALFYGESGTGKTMAAEVLANALRLDLFRIDLSAVVSKYIGETEKNLSRLFDGLERGGAVLFFDEADALFGKRSEVKDSHDRYANIEINYLLQRMESYCGLAILATNLKNALDPAFTRRLRFMVHFPLPGVAERKRLWRKAFPAILPADALDYDHLARFNLTGGSIHSIALNAAFRATRRQPRRLGMLDVLQATRDEFTRLERPINEADFRPMAPQIRPGGAP